MTEATSAFGLDAILRKVQGLIARADHLNTPAAEAESSRAMAERLMEKYRIEEAQLGDAGKLPGYLPEWRTVDLCSYTSEFRNHYRTLMSVILNHLDVRAVSKYESVNGEPRMMMEICGYGTDLRFAEMLYLQASLAFGQKLEPKNDPDLSEQINAYQMRSAGMEARRIAEAIYGPLGADDWKPPTRKVKRLFKAESIARGEDPNVLLGQGNNMKTFRTSYADGFVNELHSRFRDMHNARMMDGGIVMANRMENVKEAFYTRYPEYRPAPRASAQIGETATSKPCPKCAKAKSGACREHSYRMPRQRERSVNYGAYARGREAARDVKLDRG